MVVVANLSKETISLSVNEMIEKDLLDSAFEKVGKINIGKFSCFPSFEEIPNMNDFLL